MFVHKNIVGFNPINALLHIKYAKLLLLKIEKSISNL